MDEMLTEICQIEWTRADPTCSDYEITLVYNLPCCHVIRNYADRGFPILLECIDPHWKKLRFDEETANATEDNIREHIKNLMRKYGETNDPKLQQNLKAQMKMLYDPSKTTAREPEIRSSKRNTSSGRGKKTGKYSTKQEPSAFEYTEFYKDSQNELRRSHSTRDDKLDRTPPLPPRYSTYEKGKTKLQSSTPIRKPLQYMEQIPAVFHDHILEVNDVPGDGHCGFWVIAKALGMRLGLDDWHQVRQDLYQEIDENPSYYLDILGQLIGYEEVRNSFLWHSNSPPPEKWMYFPGSGFVIASKYNVAVVNICEYGNGFRTSTYLPMCTAPPSKPVLIIMAHVNLNHYVEIIYDRSKNNFRPFPMPPIIFGWKRNCAAKARKWEEMYRPNLKYYVALQRLSNPTTYWDPTEIPDTDEG